MTHKTYVPQGVDVVTAEEIQDDCSAPDEWGVKQVAKYFRMSEAWVYDRAQDGTLPAYKYDGSNRWRFEPSAIRAWRASQKRRRRVAAVAR